MLLKRGEDYMRLFVSVDYEGIWGVPSWEFMKTEEAKQLLHKELNVFLKSIEEVDANAYVLMVDSHSRGDNICRSMLETSSVKLDLISGYPRPNYMMTGIDNSFDGVMFVGYHTKAGGWGAMDHSYSSSTIYRVLINGKEVGESTINGFLAHYHGVPVILVSGSKELEEEIKENLPEAVFHATNKTWSRFSAQSYHDALLTLPEKVHQALQNAKQLKDSSITKIGEATFTVEFLNRLAADVTSELPFVKRLSSRTIEFTMSDYDQAFHAFQAIVFMASSAMRL
ncbi:MAG: M55 family metallopeptidase [Coprothermobacter proteolyticus]|uniref:M55 family metallopeptidase n=1 Tax=Coprothermobacter proteolyticus TaxID=35786 RepID=UPI001F2A75EF|nr:M55 family metallopeptidase [Coprothermobacter proteolyticus]